MNLRLSPDVEEALRREAERLGRSQQVVVREAVRRHLGLSDGQESRNELELLVSTGTVRPPRMPYRKATRRLTLLAGFTGGELLNRDDRV